MQRPALLRLLAFLLVTWNLASCGSAPASPVAVVPSATSIEATTSSPTAAPSDTHTPIPRPTSTSSIDEPLRPSPTPLPSPNPTLPPLLPSTPGTPLPLSLGWRFDANGHLTDVQVVQRDGQPLFLLSSLGRTVYALTGGGQLAWRLRTKGPIYALSTLGGSQVVAGDDSGAVTLLDANGRQLWRYPLGSRVTALHGNWQGGILAGGWDERLSFLGGDGELRWQADLDGPVSGITTLTDLAVVTTLGGQVQAFDPDGTHAWRFDAGAPVAGLEAAGTGEGATLLLSLQGGRLLALDNGGALRWEQAVGVGAPILHIADLLADATPEIIVGTGGTEPFLALLAAEGQTVWRWSVPSPVEAISTVDLDRDGTSEILVGLASGELQAYDDGGRLRGSTFAGLSVSGLQPAQDGSALVLADVAAWRLDGRTGSSDNPWLHPPAMADIPLNALPPAVEPAGDEAILVFLGDVAAGRSMEAQLTRYGPGYPWTGLDALLREADLAVANLECVLSTQGEPLNKSYLIRAHPRWGEMLVEGGFDLLTLANNHALDFGLAGLDETLSTLQGLDLATVGAGLSKESAHRPALFTLNGVRVAVLAYAAARWNGSVDVPATDRVAWADPATVQADVRTAREQADLVIVLLHAGTEYATTPSPDQVAVAHAAVDAGADLVVGHHPHVTQTVERYGQGLISYSLGDALFDIPRPAAMQGHLLRVHATREGLTQVELWPFWIEDAIRPRLLDDGEGKPRFQIIFP